MMKIRYALLLSVSCLGLGSLAHTGLTPDITPVGKNTSIFTQRGVPAGESLSRVSRTSYTHLASQSKLLSLNGSPRGLLSARDDDPDDLFYYGAGNSVPSLSREGQDEYDSCRSFTTSSLIAWLEETVPQTVSPFAAIKRGSSSVQLASVCFITDAGKCAGGEYGGANTPDGSSGGSSGGDDPEWELDNKERCNKEGYTLTSCSSVQDPVNFCPYDDHFFEKCVCKPNLVTCTKPYYGVGEREDGYTQTGSCNSIQNINKRCPYDANYFDKCVCRSDLYTCSSPLQGVGTACGGKYANCQCPSSYKSCDCGGAAGASSCTWSGTTKYSSCKSCCGSEYVYDSSNCAYPKKPSGAECGGKYTLCQGNCADAGYRDSIPSGQICNKISYAGKTCYTSCRTNDIPPVAKKYCSTSQLAYEEYYRNGQYLGVLVGNTLVSNKVLYNTESECMAACPQSSRGGLK